jgi:dienelactone hydrolase
VRVPGGAAAHGVLVFVHPGNSAEPMAGWAEVLERRDLVWIAAEGFGNDKPGNQRGLIALLALKQLSRTTQLDAGRRYVGGMSGGGKIASQVLTRFPGFFDGALCIVGADTAAPAVLRAADMAAKRVVFMTGDRDFNHFDVTQVFKRFVDAGVKQSFLLDKTGFGHEYPDANQLDAALALLDPRPADAAAQ